MKENTADITIILDRSASMSSVAKDTIDGFNDFVAKQKKLPVETTLNLVQFDDEYEVVHDGIPIQEVPLLDDQTFVPRGSTALLDAIGKAIDAKGERLALLPEDQRPAKVVVVIITDGYENSSTQFNWKEIQERITHQRDTYKWEFLFLGANQDAIATATSVGIRGKSSLSYVSSPKGTYRAFRSTTDSIGRFTTGDSEVAEYYDSDWEDQKDAGLKDS